MRAVYKYVLDVGETSLQIPMGGKVLSAQLHDVYACIWVEVITEVEVVETRTFRIVGTGHAVPIGALYVGTIQQSPFVWHVYEVRTV